MKKIKIITTVVLMSVLALLLPVNAFAESTAEETQGALSSNEAAMLIITAVLVVLAVISVIVANKRSKKYRQAFKKRKKKGVQDA